MQASLPFQGAMRLRPRWPLLLALTVVLAMITGVVQAQAVNPAAYWTFDEGTGTVAHDSSGNNHDATLQGAAGWTTGIVGPYALNLPGTPGSYADVPTTWSTRPRATP